MTHRPAHRRPRLAVHFLWTLVAGLAMMIGVLVISSQVQDQRVAPSSDVLHCVDPAGPAPITCP